MTQCEFIQCLNKAEFGFPFEKPKFCKLHKKDNMKYIYRQLFCPCGKIPIYGFPNNKKATSCKDCKKNGMIDIKNKKCPCGKQAYFGFPGDKKPTCCKDCKKDGMIDIKNKKCLCGSKKISIYGFPEDKRPTCCVKCKKHGMINIRNKKCPCGKRPSFGFPQDKRAFCCKDCKTDGMINIISKKCSCGKQPNFGFPNNKRATCCKDCKEDGMVDIKSKKCPCGKQPIFGFSKDKRPTCCARCKTDGMIDIIKKKCRNNERGITCFITGNEYYDGYCTRCFAKLFPNHPKTANIRKNAKELKVVNYILPRYEDFLHDKLSYPSRRRIDLRKLIKNTLLCIEIDENQHKYYSCYSQENEEIRYNDLCRDFSGKYIFIRYNPDKFKDEKGKRRNTKFETRMEVLEKEMKKHILRIEQEENEELLEIHHLFFDSV